MPNCGFKEYELVGVEHVGLIQSLLRPSVDSGEASALNRFSSYALNMLKKGFPQVRIKLSLNVEAIDLY